MSRIRIAAFLAVAALAAGVAACGDDESSSTSVASAVGAQTGTAASKAAAEGEKDAGTKVALPKRTVGYLQYTNEAEIARRMQAAAKAAAEAIGWDFIACDGQGDPRKQGACGSTLLDRGADVILANTIPPSVSKRALQTAQSKGIPWIVVGGLVEPDPRLGAIYPPDDAEMSAQLSAWLTQALGSADEKIAIVNEFPGIAGYKLRQEALKSALASHPNVTIADEEQVDYTDLVADVRRDVQKVLAKAPDVAAVFSITNDIPPVVSALRGAGKSANDGPLVVGFFADQANLDAIRAGTADAIAEWPIEGDVWASVDKAAELIARKQPLPKTLKGQYPLDFVAPTVVTKDNLPAKGKYPAPKADFVSYFKAKWGKEFGTAGN